MSKLEKIMVEQGYLVDTVSLQKKFYELIDRIEDPIDFAFVLKPYLTHVNNRYLNIFYHLLLNDDKNKDKDKLKIEAYWLIQECRSNERVCTLIKEIVENLK